MEKVYGYFPNTFFTFVVSSWVNLITHILLCPMTHKPDTLVQSIMSDSQLECNGYPE